MAVHYHIAKNKKGFQHCKKGALALENKQEIRRKTHGGALLQKDHGGASRWQHKAIKRKNGSALLQKKHQCQKIYFKNCGSASRWQCKAIKRKNGNASPLGLTCIWVAM